MFIFQISERMSIKHEFDSCNELELLDRIDRLVLPLYDHLQNGVPYPPVGYDHSKPRIKYAGIDKFFDKTRTYVLKRNEF